MSDYKSKQTFNKETNLEEIELIATKDQMDKFFQVAFKDISAIATAPGFRKGKVPKNVVLANRYNEITDRSVELLVNDAIKNLGELDPKPLDQLQITKLESVDEKDPSSDLKIIISYVPYPTIKLAEISKIKVQKPETRKTDKEEVEKEIKNIWFNYAQKLDDKVKKDDYKKSLITEEFIKESGLNSENPDLKNYKDLEKFITDYINSTYEQSSEVDYDNLIKSALVKESSFEKIEALINKELSRRVDSYLSKFTSLGVDANDYLKKNNISIDDLKKDWREKAEEDVKFEMILQEYGKQNKLTPTQEEIELELSKLDPKTKSQYDNDESRLMNLIEYYYINNRAYNELFNKIKEENK